MCLECTNFWVATDLTALAEHDTTVHGAISPPQRQQREHYLTVGSQSISSTVAFLRASDSNPFPHLRDAVVHNCFAVDDTKHNSLASSHSLPPSLPLRHFLEISKLTDVNFIFSQATLQPLIIYPRSQKSSENWAIAPLTISHLQRHRRRTINRTFLHPGPIPLRIPSVDFHQPLTLDAHLPKLQSQV